MSVVFPENEPRATTSGLRVGDTIIVAGDKDVDEVLHAFGLHKTSPRRMPRNVMGTSKNKSN